MSASDQHVWLSDARREAERQASGQTTLQHRLALAVRGAEDRFGELAGGAYGFLPPIIFLAVLHVIFLALPPIPGAPDLDEGRDFLFTLWQVSAAVIGIAFVLLILIVEAIHRSIQGEYLWVRFSRSSGLFMVTALLLGTIVAIGAGAFWLLPSSDWVPAPSSRLTNLVLLDISLFALSLAGLLWLYLNVFRFLNPSFVHRLTVEAVSSAVREALSAELRSRFENHILREECKRLGLLHDPGATQLGQMQPVPIAESGVVIDVNLRELRKLSALITSTTQPKAIVAVSPGQTLARDRNTGMFVRQDDRRVEVEAQVRRCFKVARANREVPRDLEEAFSSLTEQALRAIEFGRQDQFRRVLDALREPIRVALETLRSCGIAFDPVTARNIFPFEWPPLERPFREYERIIEAAARSGDSNIVLEAAFWPYTVMRLSLEERDHFFYREAVRYFPYLYQLSRMDVPDRSRTLLADRAWTHLKEFASFDITSRLRGAQDVELLGALRSYSAELFTAFTNLLRTAIDAGDRGYFEEAAHGYWQAIDIQFAVNAPGVAFDLTQRDPFVSASRELGQHRADAFVRIADRRDALWFSLGAWVCHRWARSHLSPERARELFALLVEPFQDFRRLWRAFNSALSTESADRLPLSTWELGEHPSERVVSLQPEAHLALFFTLVALTNIPDRIHERVPSLATLSQARWAKGLVSSALEQIRSGRERWKLLIGDTDTAAQEAEIEALVDAAEADEERRNRLRIMEQDLSPTKLEEFKAEFLEAWASSGLMRRLLADAGVIEYVRESRRNLRLLGMWKMIPKGAFVDDTGGTYWRGVGRNFGEGMASGEDRMIYEAIRKAARASRLGRETVPAKLARIIERLGEEGVTPGVILLTGGWDTLQRLERDAEFVPVWRMRYAGDRPAHFQGTFRGIPLYMVNLDVDPEFLVASLKTVGRLLQFLSEEDSIFRKFEIKDYPLESARELAAADRSWMPAEVRDLQEDQLIEYLRENVSVRIEQSLEMRIDYRQAARRLVLPTEES